MDVRTHILGNYLRKKINKTLNDTTKNLNLEIEEIKNSLMNFCDHKENWDDKAKIAKARIEKYFNAEIMGDNYMKHLSLKLSEAK